MTDNDNVTSSSCANACQAGATDMQNQKDAFSLNASTYDQWLDTVLKRIEDIVQEALEKASVSVMEAEKNGGEGLPYPEVLDEIEEITASYRRGDRNEPKD